MATPADRHVVDATQAKRTNEITPAELKETLDTGDVVVVVDVRGPDEYEEWSIEGSLNIPIQEIQQGAEVPTPNGETVVTVCAIGYRSQKAQEMLADRGYDVLNLKDGMQGWNRLFNAVPVPGLDLPGDAEVLQFQRVGKGCLSYMIASDGDAVVVDPARDWEVYQEVADARGLEITGAIDTHAHADHVSGGPEMQEALDVPYRLHAYDAIHPIDMLPAQVPYRALWDEDTLTVGDVTITVLHIPGHTLGNTALLVEDQAVLTGDSVFIGSIARPDLGGQADAWTPMHHRSLNRVLALDDDTVVLPGHFGDKSEATDGVFGERLGRLKKANEGLKKAAGDLEGFERYIKASLPEFPERYVQIKRVNAGLVDPDEDELQELEFGKQECALSD